MEYDISICIPTFNRGKRALENVKNILENIKDDWSILVLDNCSTIDIACYEEINSLSKDNKQLTYIKHESNTQFYGNFKACLNYGKSKYIMIISDEDFVNFNGLELILQELKEFKNIGACRTSISPHKDLKKPGNSNIYPDLYLKAGEESLMGFSFMGNYISGIIYNLENIKQTNLIDMLDQNIISHKAYPHLYFDLIVSSLFDVRITPIVAVLESVAEKTLIENGSENVAATHIGLYGYGERINQFLAFRNAIDDALALIEFKRDEEKTVLFINLFLKLVSKYFFLIFKVNLENFQNNKMEISSLKECFFYLVCSSILNYKNLGDYQEVVLDKIIKIYQSYKE